MPVSDFECQIARGQIGRYLDGGALSPQAMAGLEEHLSECPGCKGLVVERRATLLGALGGSPTNAVVSMPIENPLIAALRAKAEEPAVEKPKPAAPKASPRYAKEPAKKPYGKPLALGALLAVVLLGMSRVSQFVSAPTARASASLASESLPPAPTKPLEVPKIPVESVKPAIPSKHTPANPPTPKTLSAEADSIETPTDLQPDIPKVAVEAPKPKTAPPKAETAKPTLPKARTTRPVVKAKRIARKPLRVARRKPVVLRASKFAHKRGRKLSHSQKGRPRTTVRVYGLDGRILKP